MTIQTSVPLSTRTPGFYFEFNIANAARGLIGLIQRIALVGAQSAAATKTALEVNQIFSDADSDLFYGQGSELALMGKFAARGARDVGVGVQMWAIGITDSGGTAATYTYNVTGTATENKEIVLKIAGRVVRVAVATDDAAATIAIAIGDSISEQLPELMFTVGVATVVATLTAVNTGVNGNGIAVEVVDDSIGGVTVAAAAGAAGAGTIDITAALDVLEDKDYDFVAVSNHQTADISDFQDHLNSAFLPGTKRWRFGMVAENGTLATAQALADAADDFRQIVISGEGYKNTPGELAAYIAGYMGGAPDPAIPWNFRELPTLALPDEADIPSGPEIEAGINGGLFMLSVNEQQSDATIVRAVTTQTTLNSAPFFLLLDVTIPRTMFVGTRQVEVAEKQAFSESKSNERTVRRVRSVILGTLGDLEDAELFQNVDEHAGELAVEKVEGSPDRINTAIPTSVVPPLNQVVNVMNLIVE